MNQEKDTGLYLVLVSNAIEDEFSILIDDDFIVSEKLTVKNIIDKVSSLVNCTV